MVSKTMKNIGLAALLSCTASASALASPITLDGKFDGTGSDLYQLGFNLSFKVENKSDGSPFVDNGQLYFGTNADTGNHYLYFSMPTSLVDNYYSSLDMVKKAEKPEPKKEPKKAEKPEPKKEPKKAEKPEPKKEPKKAEKSEPEKESKKAEKSEPEKESKKAEKPEPKESGGAEEAKAPEPEKAKPSESEAASSEGTPGWGKKVHTFKDLLGSDALGASSPLTFNPDDPDKKVEVKVDYIAQVSDGPKGGGNDPTATVTGYKSGGVSGNGQIGDSDEYLDKSDGMVYSGDSSGILDIATTMEWNINTFGLLDAVIPDSAPDGYIAEIGYEFEFAADMFDAETWTDMNFALANVILGDAHVSPFKNDYKFVEYGDPECVYGCGGLGGGGPSPVPLPAAAWMFLGAIGAGASLYRRRRKTA